MKIVAIDFETYFDDEYSLKKLTVEAYVRDPRFRVHGVSLRIGARHCRWIAEPTVEALRSAVEWDKVAVLCHHAAFDGLILSHHYGISPKAYLDTYSMAAYLYGPAAQKGLDALAARFGFQGKSVPYDDVKGRPWASLPRETQSALAAGCINDCELTCHVFTRMMEAFPRSELPLIDLTVRMFTEPRLEGDRALLKEIVETEQFSKNERLYNLNVSEKDLASADKFARLLEDQGIEVAMKPGKLKPIPAVAKTDEFMQELLDHDCDRIRDLAEARLDIRSTIDETRSARMAGMAGRGRLCVYLHYCGAHTRRWSGGDRVNFQNLGRRSKLRQAVRAPDGYLLACPDLSQGEARILNWLAGQDDVTERFRQGHDPYLPMASLIYGEKVAGKGDPRRQAGKIAELQLGFGSGWAKFALSARRQGVEMSDDLAQKTVKLYRQSHDKVVAFWRVCEEILPLLARRIVSDIHKGPLNIDNGRIVHVNGTWLDYSGLKWEEHEWRLYGRNGAWSHMYGAKLVENIVQWLARIITGEAMVKFKEAGYPVVGMAHDDVWLLVDDPGFKDNIIAIMSATPSWAPDLPLAADCKIGEHYA